jgi:hypothetical protein
MLMTVDAYTIAFLNSSVETIHYRISFFPLYIGPIFMSIPIFYIYQPTFSEMFVILIIIYSICLLSTLLSGKNNIFDTVRKRENPFNNAYVSVIALTSAILLIIIAIDLLQKSVGIESGKLESENELLMYLSVSMAPIIEEIGFRFFILGIFTLFLYLTLSGKLKISPINILRILLNPKMAREILIEKYGRDILWKPVILMVIVSGIMFGSIHYIYGGGWEIGKVTTASLAGILLGYLYIEYGLPAAILSHYTFNHFFMTYYFISRVSEFPVIPYIVDVLIVILGISTIGYSLGLILGFKYDESEEVTVIEI